MPGDVNSTDCVDAPAVVRLGSSFVSVEAAHLHIFGVLLGAHLGEVGVVPAADLATLPSEIAAGVGDLVDAGIWWREGEGYRIEPDHAARTMRESLDRLNDPHRCLATNAEHVRGVDSACIHCGATLA